jgi:hypothetical protein
MFVVFSVSLADDFFRREHWLESSNLLMSRVWNHLEKYPDGDGLYLIIAGPKSKNWSYRYWISGKERWHGLGSFGAACLREARLKRDAARQQVRAGVDIVQAKRLAREEAKSVSKEAGSPTFRECAERFIEENWSPILYTNQRMLLEILTFGLLRRA